MPKLAETEIARTNIRRALEMRGTTSFEASVGASKNRTYLDDFLRGRKQSLSALFMSHLAQSLNLHRDYISGHQVMPDIDDLVIGYSGEYDNLQSLNKSIRELDSIIERKSNSRKRKSLNQLEDDEDDIENLIDTRNRMAIEFQKKYRNFKNPPKVEDDSTTAFSDGLNFFCKISGTALENAMVLAVTDNAMSRDRGSSFSVGDVVFIDKEQTDVRLGGIYAIGSNLTFSLRQVELVSEGPPIRVRCTAFNHDYPSFETDLVESGGPRTPFIVVGRAAAHFKRL